MKGDFALIFFCGRSGFLYSGFGACPLWSGFRHNPDKQRWLATRHLRLIAAVNSRESLPLRRLMTLSKSSSNSIKKCFTSLVSPHSVPPIVVSPQTVSSAASKPNPCNIFPHCKQTGLVGHHTFLSSSFLIICTARFR